MGCIRPPVVRSGVPDEDIPAADRSPARRDPSLRTGFAKCLRPGQARGSLRPHAQGERRAGRHLRPIAIHGLAAAQGTGAGSRVTFVIVRLMGFVLLARRNASYRTNSVEWCAPRFFDHLRFATSRPIPSGSRTAPTVVEPHRIAAEAPGQALQEGVARLHAIGVGQGQLGARPSPLIIDDHRAQAPG
jgi:hypothetical protein